MPIALRFLDNVKRAVALWHIALVHCTRTMQMRGILPRICFSFVCGHYCPLRFGKNKCNAFALHLFSFACGRSGETCRKALPSVIANAQTCLQSKRHTGASCLHGRPPYILIWCKARHKKKPLCFSGFGRSGET